MQFAFDPLHDGWILLSRSTVLAGEGEGWLFSLFLFACLFVYFLSVFQCFFSFGSNLRKQKILSFLGGLVIKHNLDVVDMKDLSPDRK